MADLAQLVGDFIGIALSAGEDHALVHVLVGQQLFQQGMLVVHAVGPVQALLDRGVRIGVLVHRDALRFARELLGQVADVAVEGGREHHRLALGRKGLGHQLDVVDKAHVEHAVSLVEDQQLDLRQDRRARIHQVEQAAGGGD